MVKAYDEKAIRIPTDSRWVSLIFTAIRSGWRPKSHGGKLMCLAAGARILTPMPRDPELVFSIMETQDGPQEYADMMLRIIAAPDESEHVISADDMTRMRVIIEKTLESVADQLAKVCITEREMTERCFFVIKDAFDECVRAGTFDGALTWVLKKGGADQMYEPEWR